MANHKSAQKRIRSNETKKLRNQYWHKSTRSAIKKLRDMESKKDAESFLPKVQSMIDKLVKRNIIHKNKGANLKSKLKMHINSLS